MTATPLLDLPRLAAGQSQKHVTVNESLDKIDVLAQCAVFSRLYYAPPVTPADGWRFLVPAGATGDWAGQTDKIAGYQNGAWTFHTPTYGWRVAIMDEGVTLRHDGLVWAPEPMSGALGGALTTAETVRINHYFTAGATNDAAIAIPDRALVLGVTGRVVFAVTGPASWRVGVPGADDRYGAGVGVAVNSLLHGPTTHPMAYFGDTPLRLTAEGDAFTGGFAILCVHLIRLTPPSAV